MMSDRRSRKIWRELGPPIKWVAHWPKFYRYRVADPSWFRPMWNKYPDQAPIGFAVTVGRYAYCVKWASFRYASLGPQSDDTEREADR